MPQEKVAPENFWGAQAPPAPPPATGQLSYRGMKKDAHDHVSSKVYLLFS